MRISELIPTKTSARLLFDGEFYVTLKHTDEKLLRELRELATPTYSKRRGSRLDDLDDTKLIDAYADKVILDWEGLKEPFPSDRYISCTSDMKRKLMHSNIDFRSWVTQQSGMISNFIEEAIEVIEEDEKK